MQKNEVEKRRMEEIEKLTPKEGVRAVCINCLGLKQFSNDAIRDCEGDTINCTYFPYRLGKRIPVKTMRKYCIKDCMNSYLDSVADCTTKDCANHPYRFGKNPALVGKRKPSKAGIEALKKYREMTRDDTKNGLKSVYLDEDREPHIGRIKECIHQVVREDP